MRKFRINVVLVQGCLMRGRIRGVYKQCGIGTTSIYTLQNMMRSLKSFGFARSAKMLVPNIKISQYLLIYPF